MFLFRALFCIYIENKEKNNFELTDMVSYIFTITSFLDMRKYVLDCIAPSKVSPIVISTK